MKYPTHNVLPPMKEEHVPPYYTITKTIDNAIEECIGVGSVRNNIRNENSVDHPDYYNSHPTNIECIEIARHYCFSIGNAIKYLWRAGLKKDASLDDKQKEIEDLEKAIWYINDRIKELKNE